LFKKDNRYHSVKLRCLFLDKGLLLSGLLRGRGSRWNPKGIRILLMGSNLNWSNYLGSIDSSFTVAGALMLGYYLLLFISLFDGFAIEYEGSCCKNNCG
jgi:hypothetical protein